MKLYRVTFLFMCLVVRYGAISPRVNEAISALLPLRNNHLQTAFFSPDDPVEYVIEYLINNEQKSIKIAAYYLTHSLITQALVNAAKRNIKIEFIGDTVPSTKTSFDSIKELYKVNIPVWYYKHSFRKGIMHNKFMIFEKNIYNHKLLLTGSFNYTLNAALRNQENILIIDDLYPIEKYEKQFEIIKERCTKIPLQDQLLNGYTLAT